MRSVLFIFFQTSNKANGGLNSLAEIILNLKNVKPVVLTQRHTDLVKRLEAAGIEIILLPQKPGGTWRKMLNIIQFGNYVAKLVRQRSIGVIHLNDMQALISISSVLWKIKARVIFNIRDVFEASRKYGMKWRLVNLCDEVIVLSQHMKEELLERLPLNKRRKNWDKRFHVSYSIVNFDRFYAVPQQEKERLRSKLEFDHTKYNLLYVATFGIKKNQLGFIKSALPLLKEKDVVIHFIGDFNEEVNPYVKQVKKAILADYKDLVKFYGFRSDVEDFYKAGDLTIVPTLREGMARCMIESLSTGTPVVSFNVSSAREILEGDTPAGLVVQQGDYNGLVKAISTVLHDEDLKKEFSENAIQLSRKLFDKSKVVEAYETVYLM